VVYADQQGGGAAFALRGDGTWTENRRRRLRLEPVSDGWELDERRERRWRFDADGVLVGFRTGAVDVIVDRTPTEVRFTEQGSRRWVALTLDPGSRLAVGAQTSDGRRVAYEYEDDGALIRVDRAQGSVTHGYDDHGYLEHVTDADGITLCRNTFDVEGRVLSQVEHHGRETAYDYGANGVATVTSTDGAPPNVMVHDRRGRMTAMIDGLGNTMRLAYDDEDNLVQVVDRLGAVTRYEYDDRGNRVRQVDPDGVETRWRHDDLDRPVEHVDRLGAMTRFRYSGAGRSPAVIEHADGVSVAIDRDDRDLATVMTDPDGVSIAVSWNDDGLPLSVVDGVAGRHDFGYDASGRLVRIDLPSGEHLSVGADRAGRALTIRTPTGERQVEYSAAGRVVGGREPGGIRWRAALDAAGDVRQVTDTSGSIVSYERDIIGQVTAQIDAAGHRSTFEYDPLGRCTSSTGPDGARTETTFDAAGRPVAVVDPDGSTWRFECDVMGRVVATTDPAGGVLERSYHPDGSLASETDAQGNTWAYEIDRMGRVVSAIDPLGNRTTYGYTSAGRLAEIRSPLGKVVRQLHDAAGRVATIVQPDGTEIHIERRADGTAHRVVRGEDRLEFAYDAQQLVSIVGPRDEIRVTGKGAELSSLADRTESASTFSHDPRGLLERVADPAGVVTEFTHDERGRLLAHATAESVRAYGYDGAGRLAEATDPYGHTTAMTRDRSGRVVEIEHSTGAGMRQRFDPLGGLVELARLDGSNLVAIDRDANGRIVAARTEDRETLVTRDALGRVAEMRNGAGTVRYGHDADGALVRVEDESGFSVDLERSDTGDVTAYVLADGRRIGPAVPVDVQRDGHRRVEVDEAGRRFRYDTAGRLVETTVGDVSTAYGYDDRGLLASERTGDHLWTHRYGIAGELLTTDGPDGRTTHSYDGLGRRTSELRADGSSIAYGWDDLGNLTSVTSTSSDGASSTRQIEHDPLGRPVSVDGVPVRWDAGATGRLLGLGDERYLWSGGQVRVAGDPDSEWSRRIPDDPWGHDGGTGVRLGYRGELALDHLLFLGDRVYDTRSRCFLSRDPLPSVPGALTFAGVYSYAWCDPVNLVDPSGRRPLSDEEFDQFVDEQTKGLLDKIDWKQVAVIALTVTVAVVATATLGPIAGGMLAGAVMGGGFSYAAGNDLGTILKDAAIGGIVGGLTGGLGKFLGPTTKVGRFLAGSADDPISRRVTQRVLARALEDVPSGFAEEGAQALVHGRDFSVQGAAMNSAQNMVVGFGGDALRSRRPTAAPDNSTGGIDTGSGGGPDVGGGVEGAPNRSFPDQGVPDPSRSVFDGVSRDQLTGVHGVGDTLADRVLAARDNGQLNSAGDLQSISGIGPKKAEAIAAALGL
ncbi:MAG: helix-hairpin-helix domain-containing protein, partial [Acidimicrobiales bacterium]|nr:helix-hairpin-helix domain-containing protein [Acidimicrobiales bacterium]